MLIYRFAPEEQDVYSVLLKPAVAPLGATCHRAPDGAPLLAGGGAINMLLLRSKTHSYRSATSGSTFVARRAGKYAANTATKNNTKPAPTNEIGSVGESSNNKDCANRTT